MAVFGIVTVYVILTFVLPNMSGLFENIGDGLPLPTVILLKVSDAFRKGGIGIVLVALILIILVRKSVRSKAGGLVSSRFLLRMPLFGEIVLKTELARFCRAMVLLLNSEIPILHALDISIPILSNEIIKTHLYKCKDDLSAGGMFGESIKKSKDLPPMMGHLITVGEESGNLNEVLSEIAENYEQETDEKIKVMTTLFEPLMILIVGLMVGFIVFAMLLPIFEIDVLAR